MVKQSGTDNGGGRVSAGLLAVYVDMTQLVLEDVCADDDGIVVHRYW